jgi:hypothetical protein
MQFAVGVQQAAFRGVDGEMIAPSHGNSADPADRAAKQMNQQRKAIEHSDRRHRTQVKQTVIDPRFR